MKRVLCMLLLVCMVMAVPVQAADDREGGADASVLSDVRLYVSPPVDGKTVTRVTDGDGERFSPAPVPMPVDPLERGRLYEKRSWVCTTSRWLTDRDEGEPFEGTFQAGDRVRAAFTLVAREGLTFAGDASVLVNGEPPLTVTVSPDGGEMTVLVRMQVAEVLPGDVNADETINSLDALLILQHSVRLITLQDKQAIAADADGNGRINAADALWVLQKSVAI